MEAKNKILQKELQDKDKDVKDKTEENDRLRQLLVQERKTWQQQKWAQFEPWVRATILVVIGCGVAGFAAYCIWTSRWRHGVRRSRAVLNQKEQTVLKAQESAAKGPGAPEV